ncbi:nascent polypeptide-associated complex subunit alpha, muscle-specific form isoform X2 [Maniola hyperantus]|uniref:nascent polypeptide-associated complex subunit alpha, muscle-specific form isoform X2 n=1 Tax=Aphantopus hyperantus TaxID=2795564 RepID=UPI00374799BE
MEEIRISDWPEPPGSHAWLPAYGFQHEIMEKEDLFGSNGDNGSNHALYLETIVEETSDDLRSERSSAATWLSDSDADSVIHVRGTAGSECDSESEREWACPAKRRRRERAASPTSLGSLSRSSSLAQFESLERSCAAPVSPSLSPDSLESPPASPPPTRPAPRAHLSAENLSEDSGYSERARRPPPPARRAPEIAHGPAGSVPCLASPSAARRPPRAARALSLPAELDVCAEPRRLAAHSARFRQSFEVCDSFTVSVADLTALDYRGGPRRPRLPPPPPPPRPPCQPPPPPPREPSAGSDSTTESERAFAREMEATARRLDETARRALADAGNYDRELSVLTARRLRDSWGAWDDVLDELRRRMEPSSATPSPPRSPSPDPVREPAFASTPLRAGDARVRSTPELRARSTPQRETPEELRASLQLVAPRTPDPAPPARSVSAGSKGVTFSPVVAEVSWRETSASSSESSARSTSASSSSTVDAADAEVTVVEGSGEARAPPPPSERDMTDAGARAPRSRIAGFLSRFANFRFSGRKEKKCRGAGANGRAGGTAPGAADAGQPALPAAGPPYVRIPLKEEVSRAAASPTPGGVAHKPPRPRPPPAPAPGVLETDVDTQRTVLHARSLLALAPPAAPPERRAPRPHKSMEFLLDKDSAQAVQPPENELQKNSDRVLSEHELRVQRSLQKLNVPEWYKNAPAPREGFLLRKRLSDASASAGRWTGLNSKTTSLGSLGANAQPPPPQLSPHTTSFGRWSTSRLNSNQTSPCSSTRSSIRGTSPLCSPSARSSFSARQPYLGWRSQERLNSTPRTPHERLASSLLQQSASAKASEEIQTSIKEVTSAIVHYVSGLEPANGDIDRQPSPRSSQKLCWLESSFVGTKPLESPQTPLVVSEALPPPHPRPPSSLRLDHRAAPDWQDSHRHSPLNLGITRPSPGSTTLEDVLDSLLGLPSQPTRIATPQPSPRKSASPYFLLGGKSPRYEQLASSGHSSISPASRFISTPSEGPSSFTDPSPDHDRAGKDSVDNPATMQESRRSKSAQGEHSRRRSEPFAHPSVSLDRRTSLDPAAFRPEQHLTHHDSKTSLASLQTENSTDEAFVKCKYPKCTSRAPLVDAKRHYKTCHNCTTTYCSKECRRAHWEKHRKVCLHSRASTLCRQIISAAKEDSDSLHQISTIAHKGYLAQGRGVVKIFFTSPEAAEKFTTHGYQYLSEPEFVKWHSLQPNEMGAELYTDIVKLCKSYNPETKAILYVAVCIISEVPTKGAVKWERQMVSRCAKLRLSKSVSAAIQEQNRKRNRRDSKGTPEDRETLILTSKMTNAGEKNAATAHKFREICFRNILKELESRGVMLKKHFPEVYSRLAAYVDGTSDRFIPMTIYPRDATSGKSFVCVIMPDSETDSTPVDGQVVTVDVGVDRSKHQLSTPM